MKKIFCFGELLLRMSPLLNGEWIRSAVMPVHIGGAELNVASALAKWNIPVQYFSVLPDNYLSKEILGHLSKKNIDVSPVQFSGNRIGSYYLPQGTDLKNTGVIYDRAYSSFSELKPASIDWDQLLGNAEWFHFSAISPALNADAAMVCKEAVAAAFKKGLTISVDLNYRSKLWQYGKQPVEIMPGLVQYCDVIMGNIWSANSLLGIALDKNIHDKKSKAAYLGHASETAENIMLQFPICKTVANTFRFDEGAGIEYYASLNMHNTQYVSPEFCTATVVDKVGSGDCFMAGLIYGLYKGHMPQNIVNFAAAAATGKLQETGDTTQQTIEQVEALIK
ncbi:MAG TPA: sugar kinase [Panacibacter sp.]|nr:sugar kinase [Panacibacter sp.]